ncbi:MAG TPA: DUF3575 domain-containing protein [Flavipsychrobacter sp.]|nr:DUF3575 domain-containing protein [Flavipsychrobacter sp.]
MKRIVLAALLSSLCAPAIAQNDKETVKSNTEFAKNNIKLNLFALPLKNFSFQYERGLNEHISVALGVRLQPKSGIAFRGLITNGLEDSDDAVSDFLNDAKMGSWGITPEFRYYFGKKPLSGFYIAPFLRVGGNSLEGTYIFKKDDGSLKSIDFSGKMNSVFGGLLFGAQWHLSKRVLLDWWIAGPSYGSIKLDLDAEVDMTDVSIDDQDDLENTLNSIGYNGKNFDAKVNDNGVILKGKLPMVGLRTGLCIGISL